MACKRNKIEYVPADKYYLLWQTFTGYLCHIQPPNFTPSPKFGGLSSLPPSKIWLVIGP